MDKAHPHFPNPAILAVPNYFLTWILTRIHPLFSRSVEEDYTINLVIGGILNTAETDCGLTGPQLHQIVIFRGFCLKNGCKTIPNLIPKLHFESKIF